MKMIPVKHMAIAILGLSLVPTYYLRLQYSLWYDEAAVVENATNSSFSDLRAGLNWLQTIPVGYFAIAKFFLQFTFGVEILRVISLLSTLAGMFIAIKHLFPPNTKWTTKWVFCCVVMWNPITITYGTMVKPYALEFLLGIVALYTYKKKKYHFLVLLGAAAPLFSNSSIFLIFAVTIALVITQKKYLNAILVLGLTLFSICISLFFTSTGTKKMMTQVWFGEINDVGLRSFKSAIGNLGWLPVSGLGVLPESGSNSGYLLVSLVTLFLILIFILFSRSDLKFILYLVLGFYICAQTFLLLPAAGRLMLGTSCLIWLLIVIRLDEFPRRIKQFGFSGLLVAVVFSSFSTGTLFKVDGNSQIKEVTSHLEPKMLSGRIYSNLWAGPAAQYYLRKSTSVVNPNLIWFDDKSNLAACRPLDLKVSDLIIFDFVSDDNLMNLSLLKYLKPVKISKHSAIFYVVKEFHLNEVAFANRNLSCRYAWSNPQYLVLDT
jgi:hypothetical protein